MAGGILRCEECSRTMADVDFGSGRHPSTLGSLEQENSRLREENEVLKRENADLRGKQRGKRPAKEGAY